MRRVRLFAVLGVLGAVWSLSFALVSTLDYASHLDRGLHDLHCSFIPGMGASSEGEGCRVALNSPYAAVLKARLWGDIPISLFAVGCFAFLLGHAAYLAVRGERVSRQAGLVYGLLAATPLLVSAGMFAISWFELGTLCKTCAGIYMGSLVLAVSGLGVSLGSWSVRREFSWGGLGVGAGVLVGLGAFTLAPAGVYAALAPDHGSFVGSCGTLEHPKEKHGALLELKGARATRTGVFFEDPLCPTCKSLHERLAQAGALEELAIQLALFPLDNECNWMLDHPLHPGACDVSRAILCAQSPGEMLAWTYEHQSALGEAGKAGGKALTQLLEQRWGKGLSACMRSNDTTLRLNRHLHFAVENSIAVSTPQVFIDGQRLCDEDIDIGLNFALSRLAPGLIR